MIVFPKELTFNSDEEIQAKCWADNFSRKNSAEGAVYGKLCELALARELKTRGHDVVLNDELNKNDLFWDLIVDGVKVDVKATRANSFTFSRSVQENLYDVSEKLFVCYSFSYYDNKFDLIGVLTSEDVKRNVRASKIDDGYYIMKYIVKANGHQSLS